MKATIIIALLVINTLLLITILAMSFNKSDTLLEFFKRNKSWIFYPPKEFGTPPIKFDIDITDDEVIGTLTPPVDPRREGPIPPPLTAKLVAN